MGTIYLARDGMLNRRVALKLVRASNGATEAKTREATARLLREARAAAKLQHTNAVAIHDIGEIDAVAFIAMEFVSGRPPQSARGGAAVEDASALARRRGEGARCGARAGLVHRDIKPENVMVRDDGVVKVLDFGIARHAAVALDPTGETHRRRSRRSPPKA